MLYGLIHLPTVQTWLVQKVSANLSEKLGTRVSVKKVNIQFLNRMVAEDLLVEDKKKDTLVYANFVSANVTNWFIFKDAITLKNIELRNAVVNLARTDSVWNYQHIVDYFKSPKKKKKTKPLELDVKDIHFTNIRFNKVDRWVGQMMTASFKSLDVITDSINIPKNSININTIKAVSLVFWQKDFDGNRPDYLKPIIVVKPKKIQPFQWNTMGLVLNIRSVEITDGQFRNDKNTKRAAYVGRFDGQHIHFTNIDGKLTNVKFYNDTLTSFGLLKGKEKSGFEIKELKANLKFTPVQMEFSKLNLETNKSKLGDYFSMSYTSFKQDFSNFLNAVQLNTHFTSGSKLYSDDLAFFGPNLKTWNRVFMISGDAKGTVPNFTATNLKVRTGDTYLDGRLSMRGLPDINSTFIDFYSNDFRTTYKEAAIVLPAIRNSSKPAFSKLGNISYKGNFTGFIKDFVAFGTLKTSLGTIVADINMKVPNQNEASYSGDIKTEGFQLGSFLNDKKFGIVAMDGSVKGNGFDLKKLSLKTKAFIKKIYYNGYTYQNLNIDGGFQKFIFSGVAAINDPNIKIDKFSGQLNLNKNNPLFTLNASAQKIDFRALGFTRQKLILSGDFDLNFTGSNIDNFLGVAQINDAVLLNDSSTISFSSLRLSSTQIGNEKRLALRSTEIDADIIGDFKILELPNAFTVFLSKYYPAYIKTPKQRLSNENFSFNIRTKNIDDYIAIFNNNIKGFNNASISGNVELLNYQLNLKADIPYFSYNDKSFTNTLLEARGNRDSLFATMAVDDVYISDSFHLPQSNIRLTAHDDISDISIKTTGSKTLNDAELNAVVTSYEDGVNIKFMPSSIVINNKKWELNKDGELTLRKKFIDAEKLTFTQGEQQIVIATEYDDLNSGTNIAANITKLNIGDFTPFFVTKPALKGQLTGKAILYNIYGKQIIDFNGMVDQFSVDTNFIGKVNLTAAVNLETGKVNFKAKSTEKDYDFDVAGGLDYKDSTGNQLNIDFNTERFQLKILKPFLTSIFSNMNGVAVGKLNIKNEGGNQYITGKTTIQDGSMVVAYTNVEYFLKNQVINFTRQSIDFGTMAIEDGFGNKGTISGRINHRFFKDFSFPFLQFESDKLQLLNTTKANNPQYYGTVFGNVNMTLTGPVTDMQMNIAGGTSATDSSHVYLQTATGRESSKVDYIEFIQFGTEMEKNLKIKAASKFTLNMDITANPACKVDIILDEETGDIIKGQGNGQLNIRVGTTEPLRMNGRYDITKGFYLFNFQTFIRKPFEINSGSVTWNGDPLAARINIPAQYTASNVDISNLTNVTIAGGGSSGSYQKSDILILANLTGILTQPDISFEFALPEGSEYKRDYVIVKRLEDYKTDEALMLNQVASLILFNSFFDANQSFISQQSTITIGTTLIGGIISNLLTNLLNRELSRATNGLVSSYININPSLDLQSNANQLQANIRGGIRVTVTDRLYFYAGGNFDYNNQLIILNRRSTLNPDFTLEWLISKDGSLKVIAFNRTSVDLANGQRNRSGVQLGYRRDVNKFSDLFRSKKRLLEEERLETEAVLRAKEEEEELKKLQQQKILN